MMRSLALGLAAAVLGAQPVSSSPALQAEYRGGVLRAVVLHAAARTLVSDADPAKPGETLIAFVRDVDDDFHVQVGGNEVKGLALLKAAQPRHFPGRSRLGRLMLKGLAGGSGIRATGWDKALFTIPSSAGGSFVELSVACRSGRTNAATIPIEQQAEDPSQLTAAEVEGLIRRAAMAIEDASMAVAVTDRAGRPLAVLRKPEASNDAVETALSLARTGAFFSHNMAPLSSRTVRSISRDNFPSGVPNQPAGALFGIENTNRGCFLSDDFAPGKSVPPATRLDDAGPGKGVTTIPGGIPLFKNRAMVGGLGVAGVDPNAAEFAAVAAVAGTEFFVPLPLPPPGAVFIDGIRLPFVTQTTQPEGTQPAAEFSGEFLVAPRAGAGVPDGYLVEPQASATLTANEVNQIIQAAVERAQKTRAVIRLPLGSRSRMAMAVSDLDGKILGLFRMPDATVFSIDVAATKARNVVYFSGSTRAERDLPGVPIGTAVTNRTIGFGSQPFFPSGIANSSPGPFRELFLFDLANPCTQGSQAPNRNQSGIVFFPGSVPLYKNGQLVGGLGVSGDGVEQDDYVSAGGAVGFEPPPEVRADRVFIDGVRLPFWRFPRNPEQ